MGSWGFGVWAYSGYTITGLLPALLKEIVELKSMCRWWYALTAPLAYHLK
jgi:hypothetical protein